VYVVETTHASTIFRSVRRKQQDPKLCEAAEAVTKRRRAV
jgi:hypothetical protein